VQIGDDVDQETKDNLKAHVQAAIELLMPDESVVGDRDQYPTGTLDRSIAIQLERIMEDLYFVIDTIEGRTREIVEDRRPMSTFDELPRPSTQPNQ